MLKYISTNIGAISNDEKKMRNAAVYRIALFVMKILSLCYYK